MSYITEKQLRQLQKLYQQQDLNHVAQTLQKHRVKQTLHPFQPIQEHPSYNTITLGTTKRNKTYRIQTNQLTKHLLGFGETGTGKTNTNYLLLKQLNQKNIPFTLIDFKQDYLTVAINDWRGLLKEVEASEDTENAKQALLREMRETESKLKRTGENQ